ncbi:unnamed protein product [Oncorhynchus mykiss]|uniref:RIIa domain-containing protein n=1 Tax=Oncorhynchus mykiss TaxID=8022 RepID=A0A060YFD7_ONCMY|nr:unnamed protein product [Oncorhynchus mykiss]
MADKRGLEKLDFGALSIEQQQQLRQFKMYFSKDPDIREYAADYFTDPNLGLIIGSKLQSDPADTGTD